MSSVTTRPQSTQTSQGNPALKRQYVNFVGFKVDSEWRRLSDEVKDKGKREFARVIERFVTSKRCQIITYTTMGMRSDCDILLWIIGPDLDILQEVASSLAKTGLGKYLSRGHNFISMTKRSVYVDRFHPEHQEDRIHIRPGKHKYLFVYPFLKKREWYLLSMEDRQKMMDEHIRIGNQYPSVKLNTTYSFGLDDQEFVVAFETDIAQDFLDLVQELRESQSSLYTLRDTPIITCINSSVEDMLDSIG